MEGAALPAASQPPCPPHVCRQLSAGLLCPPHNSKPPASLDSSTPPHPLCSHSRFHPGPHRLMQLMEAGLPQLEAFTPESFCAMLFALACLRVRPGARPPCPPADAGSSTQ